MSVVYRDFNRSFRVATRWVSSGNRGVGLGFESREHEILSQVLTGLARARGFLIEEVPGPHSFGIINLIY
jgi:hypothetical protein